MYIYIIHIVFIVMLYHCNITCTHAHTHTHTHTHTPPHRPALRAWGRNVG